MRAGRITRFSPWRGAVRRAGAAGALLGALACVGDRERLDAPRVEIEVTTAEVAPGGRVLGVVTATDRSGGIILVSVRAEAGDSAFRQRSDFVPTDSVSVEFDLRVASTAPDAAPIIVRATVIDDQSFVVTAEDTAVVRVPAQPR